MRPDEVAELLAYISDSVPNGTYGDRAVQGFYDGLHDLPTEKVVAATKSVIRRKPFKPSVSEIRDEVYRLSGIGDADDEWIAILEIVKQGPPWPTLENPVAEQALQSIGGLPMLRLTERPDMARKDFVAAYDRVRDRELGEPKATMLMLRTGRGAAGKLAGTSEAIGAGE